MDHEIKDKIVDFEKYCPRCQFYQLKPEGKDHVMPEPCDECLTYPSNEGSQKPIKYIENLLKEKKQKNIKEEE